MADYFQINGITITERDPTFTPSTPDVYGAQGNDLIVRGPFEAGVFSWAAMPASDYVVLRNTVIALAGALAAFTAPLSHPLVWETRYGNFDLPTYQAMDANPPGYVVGVSLPVMRVRA